MIDCCQCSVIETDLPQVLAADLCPPPATDCGLGAEIPEEILECMLSTENQSKRLRQCLLTLV